MVNPNSLNLLKQIVLFPPSKSFLLICVPVEYLYAYSIISLRGYLLLSYRTSYVDEFAFLGMPFLSISDIACITASLVTLSKSIALFIVDLNLRNNLSNNRHTFRELTLIHYCTVCYFLILYNGLFY